MLEYFNLKKLKKHREGKAADEQKTDKDKQEVASETSKGAPAAQSDKVDAPSPSPQIISKPAGEDDVAHEGTPVLDHEDEEFLKRLTSGDMSIASGEDDETPPPLPPRVKTPVIEIDSDTSSVSSKEVVEKKGKGKEESDRKETGKGKGKVKGKTASGNKSKRFSFVTNLPRALTTRRKAAEASASTASGLDPDPNHLAVPGAEAEAASEKNDMARVLDDLDLSAKNNRVFSLSAESAETVRRFTQVLKDLVNGVPTAYGDLVKILEDRDGILARNYEKLPKSLKKLITQLPEKLTSSFAPELLAVAAEAQGLTPLEVEGGGEGSGLKGAAKKFLTPSKLRDLVTKPGALVGMLKGIVNALKTRFPAFVGTNVLWSLAVFLLLSMLWYCYKRGREVRLEREASEAADKEGKTDEVIDGQPRVEELPDDPQLPAASGKEEVSPNNGANEKKE